MGVVWVRGEKGRGSEWVDGGLANATASVIQIFEPHPTSHRRCLPRHCMHVAKCPVGSRMRRVLGRRLEVVLRTVSLPSSKGFLALLRLGSSILPK